ncbi:MAG: hypothetical protein SO029_04190, partial [Sodaliphilus sp.]|nr:hypothetical protein [Sodaliphilus sp.]
TSLPGWFFAEGEWFLSFLRYHRPRGEGGVGVVVWLIQASASNHKPKKSQTKGTVLLVCGLCGVLEIRHATSPTTGAKHWHR